MRSRCSLSHSPLAEAGNDRQAAQQRPQSAGSTKMEGYRIVVDEEALNHPSRKNHRAAGHYQKAHHGFKPVDLRPQMFVPHSAERFHRAPGHPPKRSSEDGGAEGHPYPRIDPWRRPVHVAGAKHGFRYQQKRTRQIEQGDALSHSKADPQNKTRECINERQQEDAEEKLAKRKYPAEGIWFVGVAGQRWHEHWLRKLTRKRAVCDEQAKQVFKAAFRFFKEC